MLGASSFAPIAEAWLLGLAAAMPVSIAITSLLVFSLLTFYLFAGATTFRAWPMAWGPAEKCFLLFAALGLLSAVFGAAPQKSLYTLRNDFYFLIYALVAALACESSLRARLWYVFFWAGCLTAAFGILQHFLGVNETGHAELQQTYVPPMLKTLPSWMVDQLALASGRAVGTRSHPLTYAEGLLFPLAYGLSFLFLKKRKFDWPIAFGILLLAGGLLFSESRGPWLASLAMAASLIVLLPLPLKWRPILLLALPAVALSFNPPLRQRAASIVDPQHHSNAERLRMWKAGLEILKEHPLLGIGPGALKKVVAPYQDPLDRDEGPWGHLHNTFVNIAVERGLLGLAGFLGLIGAFGWQLRRRLRSFPSTDSPEWPMAAGALLGGVGFLVCALTETVYNDAEIVMLMYFVLGLALPNVARKPQ